MSGGKCGKKIELHITLIEETVKPLEALMKHEHETSPSSVVDKVVHARYSQLQELFFYAFFRQLSWLNRAWLYILSMLICNISFYIVEGIVKYRFRNKGRAYNKYKAAFVQFNIYIKKEDSGIAKSFTGSLFMRGTQH